MINRALASVPAKILRNKNLFHQVNLSRFVVDQPQCLTTVRQLHGHKKKKDIFETKTVDEWKLFFERRQEYGIVKHLNFQIVSIEHGKLVAKVDVQQDVHMAPNGYMHAAGQVFLADTGIHALLFVRDPFL